MESQIALVPAPASAVEGLSASANAARLTIPPATLSTHLRILTGAGLLNLKAASRGRVYAVRFEAMRELIAYLLEDCCPGSAEVCTPLAGLLASQAACCGPAPKETTHEAPARSRRR